MNRPTQRAFMRELVRRHGRNRDRVTTEYARGERRGSVERRNNASGYTPEVYARRLWDDEIAKGWLL